MTKRGTIMKKVVVATAALLFVSCVSGGHGTDPNKTNSDWGWRSAGLTASSVDLGNNSGYQKITHVGNRLFVMDARWVNGRQRARMFTSMQGSSTWDTLWMPNGMTPESWLPADPFLYVGTDTLGQVWKYDTRTATWTDLKTNASSIYMVQGLAMFQSNLIAAFASPMTYNWPIKLMDTTGNWKDINHDTTLASIKSFHTGIEYHGTFYAATYDTGVWAWTPSDSMWRKVTDPPYGKPTLSSLYNGYPRSMSIFNDSLYVGYWNGGGLDRYLGENSWNREDSCINYKSDGVSLSPCNSPVNIYASAIWNNHLIVSGYYSSIPVVDMAPAKPKGWSLLGGDTWKGGFTTYDMTVVGDTLYTASWEAVWKYPLSQLDSAVKMYSAYPQYPSSSSATTALTKKK